MDRGFGGRDRYDDRSRDYDRGGCPRGHGGGWHGGPSARFPPAWGGAVQDELLRFLPWRLGSLALLSSSPEPSSAWV